MLAAMDGTGLGKLQPRLLTAVAAALLLTACAGHAPQPPDVARGADVARTVLLGYQGRYGALKDAVTETSTFDDQLLTTVPPLELLTEPVYVLADRWTRG